jgi:hypothetical protein
MFFRHGQQTTLQNPQPFRATKVVCVLISRSGDKISSMTGKLVRGCVRPRGFWFSHEMTMVRVWLKVKSKFQHRVKAAEGCRSPRRWREI